MALEFFRPGTSILHRFDPRAKLLLLAVLVLCFFLPFRLEVSLFYLTMLVATICFCLGAGELKKPFIAIAPLLIVISVFTPFLRISGDVLWAPFGITYISSGGLNETAGLIMRFVGITLGFFAVFRSIDPNDLILTLRWFGLSFRAALVLVITLRFIPSLVETYGNVRDAHSLRNGEKKKGIFAKLIPVLTSILINAVRGIPTLAMTLEARGFGRSNKRTEYAALGSGKRLTLHLCTAGLLAVLFLSPFILLP